jgi:flagellar hook-basal body complex protein FliE
MMFSIRPELQHLNPMTMRTTNPKHYAGGTVVGFAGGGDYGGALADLSLKKGQGAAMAETGTAIGADAVLRDGSLGAAGLNRHDGASFSDAMLHAIDNVSGLSNRADDLQTRAIVDPQAVNIHDITLAQSEAYMALDVSATILNRLTQGWRDLLNTR